MYKSIFHHGPMGLGGTILRIRNIGVPVLLAVSLSAATASARDEQDRYKMLGAGSFKCAKALEAARDPAVKRVLETWMAGYITAANFSETDTFNIVGDLPTDQLVPELLSQCHDAPDELIGVAMAKLLQRFYPNRHKTAP